MSLNDAANILGVSPSSAPSNGAGGLSSAKAILSASTKPTGGAAGPYMGAQQPTLPFEGKSQASSTAPVDTNSFLDSVKGLFSSIFKSAPKPARDAVSEQLQKPAKLEESSGPTISPLPENNLTGESTSMFPTGPDTLDTLKYVTDAIVSIPAGIIGQETNPSPEELSMEKIAYPNGPQPGDVPVVNDAGRALARGFMRFWYPMTQTYANDFADAMLSIQPGKFTGKKSPIGDLYKGIFKVNSGRDITLKDILDLPAMKKSATQIAGDAAQSVLAAYTPAMITEGAAASASKGVLAAMLAGAKESAINGGIPFAVAQIMAQGTSDPKEIADITFRTVVGMATLGVILHATVPASKAAFKSLTQDVIESYGLPKTISLNGDEVFDILGGIKNEGEKRDALLSLGLDTKELMKARKEGITVNISTDKFVQVMDKPWFAALKNKIGLAPIFKQYREGGVSTIGPRGLLETADAKKAIDTSKSTDEMADKLDMMKPGMGDEFKATIGEKNDVKQAAEIAKTVIDKEVEREQANAPEPARGDLEGDEIMDQIRKAKEAVAQESKKPQEVVEGDKTKEVSKGTEKPIKSEPNTSEGLYVHQEKGKQPIIVPEFLKSEGDIKLSEEEKNAVRESETSQKVLDTMKKAGIGGDELAATEREVEARKALANPAEKANAIERGLKDMLMGHVEGRKGRIQEMFKSKSGKELEAAIIGELKGAGGGTLDKGFSWNYDNGSMQITHTYADEHLGTEKPVATFTYPQLVKEAKRLYNAGNEKGPTGENMRGDIRPGDDFGGNEAIPEGPSGVRKSGKESGKRMARGENKPSGASAAKRPGARIKAPEGARDSADLIYNEAYRIFPEVRKTRGNMDSVRDEINSLTASVMVGDMSGKEAHDSFMNFMESEIKASLPKTRENIPIKNEFLDVEKQAGSEPKGAEEEIMQEAIEREQSTGLKHEDIIKIIDQKAVIDEATGEVLIPKSERLSDSDLDIINKYDPSAGGKEKQGAEGRGLLDEYYTPTEISDMAGTILEGLGAYKDGMKILEPSAGIGTFIYNTPLDSKIDAFEINPTAAKILKLNHQEARVFNKPFESMFMTDRGRPIKQEGTYDLVFGNPPYGSHRGKYKGLGEEKEIERYEDYFLKRALDITKEGGHVAFVMPHRFLNSAMSTVKYNVLGHEARIVAAYRFPNGAFPTTDIGVDLVVFKKEDQNDLVEAMSSSAEMSNGKYFEEHPENILGVEGMREGKFGMESFVDGTLESAIDAFHERYNIEEAKKESPSDIEIQDGIADDMDEARKPMDLISVRKEVSADMKPEAPVKNPPKPRTKKKSEESLVEPTKQVKMLDLSSLSKVVSAEDMKEWENVSATGELTGDFNKDKAFYFDGKYYNKFNYLQGDIYEKLDRLELDKSSMSAEKYAEQKKALRAVLPKPVTVDTMNVAPNTTFVKNIKFKTEGDEESIPLADHFTTWLGTLPYDAFAGSNRYDIVNYVDNVPVRGGDKISNEKNRRLRREQGDRLFRLYMRENIPDEWKAKIEDAYNRQFNAYHRPNYLEVPLTSKISATFNGKPLEIKDVQLQGVGFLVNKGIGLLAHDVGVGKTMQAIIAIKEILNRNWAKKPLVVVPSVNVYNQWIHEINELIPGTKINLLANLGGEFKGELKTLEVDEGSISIITNEGFKRLGFKNETYDELTKDFFDTIENPGEKTKRQEAAETARAQTDIGKGIKGTREDRFFEDLGFDHITVDEVHNANHIIGRAKMEKDSGKVSEFRNFNLRPSELGIKAWLATQYVLKHNNNRNVQLLSATPFTNHPLEYYSILSLMARGRMARMGLTNVNDFMNMFMDISTLPEFKADGTYVEKSEVRAFKNYQQFQKLLNEFIDFRDGIEAGVKRPDRVPKEYIVAENSITFDYKVKAQELFKDKDAGTLRAINELRAIAFSPYLSRYHGGTTAPTTEQFIENSPKLKATISLILQNIKDNPEAGQLVYSPIGIEYFPLIKEALVKGGGLDPSQVEIISSATPQSKRSLIQENFNQGKVKVVIGSDSIQEGVNLQRNTTDLYILSLPWNFTDVRQVIGRAWRQGNRWTKIRVNNVFTENSIDTFLSQKLQNKEKRYEESLKFKGDTLDVGDIDFEELKFDLVTDPVVRTELEYKLKEQELGLEADKLKSEMAYKHRKARKLIDAQEKVQRYEQHLRDSTDVSKEYWQREVKDAKDDYESVKADLKNRGVNIEATATEIEDTGKKIEAIEKKIEALKGEKEKAMTEAMGQRIADTSRETNYGAFVKEREEENTVFYNGGPLFERSYRFLGGDKMPVFMNSKLTEKEHEAITLYQHGDRSPDTMKSIKSGWEKYLVYTEEPAFTRELSTNIVERLGTREVVSRQFIEDLLKMQGVKEAEKKVINEALSELPEDSQINVEQFGSKVASKLLDLKVSTALDGDKYFRIALPDDIRGEVADYKERVYESPINTSAGGIHFSEKDVPKYFAHTRIEDIAMDGKTFTTDSTFGKRGTTRRVIEVQSDLFQKGGLDNQYPDAFAPIPERSAELSKLESYRNTWHERIIQEEIKNAAKDGKTTLLFPTGETAMKIEGLGSRDRFVIKTANDEYFDLTMKNMKVGQTVIFTGEEDLGPEHEWIITDVLGDGKFRAALKKSWDQHQADLAKAPEGPSSTELTKSELAQELNAVKETFDASGKMSKTNPIYRFYENDVAKYLQKIRPDFQLHTDEEGVTWWKTQLTKEDLERPVMAFSRMPFNQYKYQATSFDQAKDTLQQYKDRFKLDFDVDFAHAIFTGDVRGAGFERVREKAYAVTYNNKISLTENVTRTTADHEFVHIVMENMDKIGAFKDFSRADLLRAANGGRDYTNKDMERLNEEIAVGFEEFVAGRARKNANILGRFFQALKDMLYDLFKALGARFDDLRDFYETLARGEGKETAVLESKPELDNEIRTIGPETGNIILDFGLKQAIADFDRNTSELFQRIPDEIPTEGDENRDLIRRDINVLEDLTAQARDIFLKDPNEFAAAHSFEKAADLRRDRKYALDKSFSKDLEPYFKGLSKKEQIRVSEVLMRGDEFRKDFTDQELTSLTPKEAAAYKSVRTSFRIAHEILLNEMAKNGVPPSEVDQFRQEREGYMPHKWPYRYAVKTSEMNDKGVWKVTDMSTFKTESQARAEWEKLKETNKGNEKVSYTLDTLDNLSVDFFSDQHLSVEAIKSAIAQAKVADDVKKPMIDALRNMAKEKGFGRHFIKRTGVMGYDKADVPKLIADYFNGFSGFLTKMQAAKEYYNILSTIDARRQGRFYNWMKDMIAYDMGNTREWNKTKRLAFTYLLANDLSFLITNATQNLTVGMGELSKHLEGKDKIVGPEKYMFGAMIDWSTGRASKEEKAVVQNLLDLGELGGSIISEMANFKNNPLYTEISSAMNKALYSSTSFVESHVNRIPAFLAARRVFLAKGMTEKEANEAALDFSKDTHFRYGKQNRPRTNRGGWGIFFMFTHYMRSLLYQLARDLSDKEFMAFGRKMMYTFILGGASALPFATTILTIYRDIFGATGDKNAAQEMDKWQLALEKGLPALVGVDMSGRVGLDIFSVDSILQNPQDPKRYFGSVGSLFWPNFQHPENAGRIFQGAELLREQRYIEALGKLAPDFIGNVASGLYGYTYGINSFAGTPLQDANGDAYKYNTWEAIVRSIGFTPTTQSLIYDDRNNQFTESNSAQAANSSAKRAIQGYVNRGDIAGARTYQENAAAIGAITSKTDYVAKLAKSQMVSDALNSIKGGSSAREAEKKLLNDLYPAGATSAQATNLKKDFAVFQQFGTDNKDVNAILSAKTNEAAAVALLDAQKNMSQDEFNALLKGGRKTVTLDSGKESPILISDNTYELYRNYAKNGSPADNQPTYKDQQRVNEKGILSDIVTYARAIGTDPETAFNRIFTGQRIVRVSNGAIIVERMPLSASQNVKKSQGGNNPTMKLDHTVPLELGGSNDVSNLKLVPTAVWASYTATENYLGKLLGSGRISSKEAQDLITRFKKGEITADYIRTNYK